MSPSATPADLRVDSIALHVMIPMFPSFSKVRNRLMRTLPLALLAGLALACQRQDVAIDPAQLAAFAPLPASMPSEANPITPEKVELGWRLYYETQLSADGSQSCNSCHLLDAYGVDGQPVSTGVTGEKGGRNAPTVYNAAGHIAQFWDGRAADVEEQATGPILNPIEMAIGSPKEAIARLADPRIPRGVRRRVPGRSAAVVL
jgi:cytochrome c peroxidase